MVYRHPTGFFCTAEKLLELILMDDRIILEEHKNFLILAVKDVYGNIRLSPNQILFMMLTYPFDSRVGQIIRFGKDNNIPMQDWLEAIEKRS